MFPCTDGSSDNLSFKLNILKAKSLLLPMTWQLFSPQQLGAMEERCGQYRGAPAALGCCNIFWGL